MQTIRYTPELWRIARIGTISPEQRKRAEKIYNSKTARANCFTQLKQESNYLCFKIYGNKKINGTYNETSYIFDPSGVLTITQYNATYNTTKKEYFKY